MAQLLLTRNPVRSSTSRNLSDLPCKSGVDCQDVIEPNRVPNPLSWRKVPFAPLRAVSAKIQPVGDARDALLPDLQGRVSNGFCSMLSLLSLTRWQFQ